MLGFLVFGFRVLGFREGVGPELYGHASNEDPIHTQDDIGLTGTSSCLRVVSVVTSTAFQWSGLGSQRLWDSTAECRRST